jgi:hypothetical protein
VELEQKALRTLSLLDKRCLMDGSTELGRLFALSCVNDLDKNGCLIIGAESRGFGIGEPTAGRRHKP